MFNFPVSTAKRISLLLLAAFFILAGLNHFVNKKFYMSMMPPYLPAHTALVYVSGLFEILGGIGVLFAKTRKWAGYGLIALMVAVFPANIYMAMNPSTFCRKCAALGIVSAAAYPVCHHRLDLLDNKAR